MFFWKIGQVIKLKQGLFGKILCVISSNPLCAKLFDEIRERFELEDIIVHIYELGDSQFIGYALRAHW